jgi:hypothetical protein
LEALIIQLRAMEVLLRDRTTDPKRKQAITQLIDKQISNLRLEETTAIQDGKQAAFYASLEGAANGLKGLAAASIDLYHAVQSGDPFTISASTLDLAAMVIGTVSLAGGPIGAVVGAVVGAILSIVSMILKMFQKEAESLIQRIQLSPFLDTTTSRALMGPEPSLQKMIPRLRAAGLICSKNSSMPAS